MDAGRMAGAAAGGLIAGLGMTALLIATERRSGQPSELIELQRAGLAKLGAAPVQRGLPTAGEQASAQAGHLLLSALAGAAYGAATDDEARVVPSGLAFGAAFYAAMHWVLGPALGVKAAEYRSDDATLAMHLANHLLLGLAAATGARLAADRDG